MALLACAGFSALQKQMKEKADSSSTKALVFRLRAQ